MASRYFFMDMNAFFASVEQQERPELRGRPIVVAPVLVDTTCAIAASYEAKKWGIKTGTSVKQARLICPELQIVESRPELYMSYHRRILEVLNDHFTDIKVFSVDEVGCPVAFLYDTAEKERRMAQRVKEQLYHELGSYMRCSVGIAPNIFLAKVAAEMQKPDGLTLLDHFNLKEALCRLDLSALPGIGSAMERRLNRFGIHTVEALWNASPWQLRRAWGSVVGARWYFMLRGSHQCDYTVPIERVRQSVGHSHVLPPDLRNPDGARGILLQLCARALKRLRDYRQKAASVEVEVRYRLLHSHGSRIWRCGSRRHPHSSDDVTWLKVVRPILAAMPNLTGVAAPEWVAISFSDLLADHDVPLSLFEEYRSRARCASTVDIINDRFGHVVDLLSIQEHYGRVPRRIPFGPPTSALFPPVPGSG